jgi:hypothetical protein
LQHFKEIGGAMKEAASEGITAPTASNIKKLVYGRPGGIAFFPADKEQTAIPGRSLYIAVGRSSHHLGVSCREGLSSLKGQFALQFG